MGLVTRHRNRYEGIRGLFDPALLRNFMYPSGLTTGSTALLLQIRSFARVRVYANQPDGVASPQVHDLMTLVKAGYVDAAIVGSLNERVDHTFEDLCLTPKGCGLFEKIMHLRPDEPTVPLESSRKCWDIEGRQMELLSKLSGGAYKARDHRNMAVTIVPADWGVHYFTSAREAAHAALSTATTRATETLATVERARKVLLAVDGLTEDSAGGLVVKI